MKIYIDDGSTNIKLQWKDDAIRQSISPNSFKREWAVAFAGQLAFNYMLNGEQYSFDPISPEAVVTTNVAWQYSDVNVIAVHHALLHCGIEPCEIDVVVSLPLSEYYDKNNQPNKVNIERKKANLLRPVELNGGKTFIIKHVDVMPESVPAGFEVVRNLNELDSLLIVDLGGTTLDISQVMGKMRGISRIYGDSTLGVSLITNAVKEALSVARTKGSSYLADDIIIHRNDASYLASRINDTSRIELVREAIENAQHRLVSRVIEAISRFEGYSHVMVIGGGAELIADDVKKHCGIREGRFYKTSSSQFDLVNGMYLIG